MCVYGSKVHSYGVNGYRAWPYLRDEQREWAVVVGDRIRRLRLARGWNIWDLAQATVRPDGRRYSVSTFSRLERGSGASQFLLYLEVANALEVDAGRLLGPDAALLDATEPEMTLIRSLRELQIEPHEALALLVQARSTAIRSSSPSM